MPEYENLSITHGADGKDRPSRLLRLPEVMDRVGLKRSAIYQRMSEGKFPRSRSLGPKCAVWVEAEIDEWIERVAEIKIRKTVL